MSHRTATVRVGPASATGTLARAAPVRAGLPDRARGMVTAELAMALPCLVVVLLAALVGLRGGYDDLRCADAAHRAALAIARGLPVAIAVPRAAAEAPPGAVLTVVRTRDVVTVTVTAPVALPASLRLAGWHLQETGVADLPPGTTCPRGRGAPEVGCAPTVSLR